MKSAYISQLQWSNCGYSDVHGVRSDGGLVFLRRVNTLQAVQNSSPGGQHDGSTITFIGSGLDSFNAIRITLKSGRLYLTGLAFTTTLDGTEGTGMVNPAQITGTVSSATYATSAGTATSADSAGTATTATNQSGGTVSATTITSSGIITCNANKMVITGNAPTLYLRDSDGRTGMIHQNANIMYFLSGAANSDVWAETVNSRWPLYLVTTTNQAVFGGDIDAAAGTVTAAAFSGGTVSATNGTFSGTGPVINCTASNPGDMISKRYASADRYGMGQYDGGATRLFTSTAYGPATIRLSGATNDVRTGAATFTDYVTVKNNGNVGIMQTGPGYRLSVNGSLFYSSGGLNGSDDRIKYNEENITNALDIICKLKPQKYEKIMVFPSDATGSWIPTDENWETVKNAETKPWEGFTHGDEYGFIAQDVRNIPEVSFLVSGSEMKTVDESVSPEEYVNLNEDEQGTYTRKYVYEENVITIEEYTNLISENKDKCTGIYIKQVETQTPLGLNYQGIFVVAVKAIQEIDAQLQAEKVRNDALEARILALESA